MARTAPIPNFPAIPGMNPGIFVLGGGGDGGGSGAGRGKGKGGKQGAGGKNGGNDANGGGKGADSCGKGTSSCPGPHGGKGTTAGHPVDLATGAVFTEACLDLFLPGPFPLELFRQYRSTARERDVGLGFGWTHTFAWTIEVRRRTLTLWKDDGKSAVHEMPEAGTPVSMEDGWLLSRDNDGFKVVDNDGIVWVFAERDRYEDTYRLSAVVDRSGNAISLFYEGGRLVQLLDSVGRTVVVRWGRDGHIIAFEVKNTSHQGQWVTFFSYTYDDHGDLVALTDAEGYTTTFKYQDHLMTEEQSPGGLRAVFLYDDAGRCVETWCDHRGQPEPSLDVSIPAVLADDVTPAKGILHNKMLYADDGVVEVINSTQVRRLFANGFGKVDKGTLGGAVFSHTYDADGHETSYTDPLGHETRYVRDADGRVIEKIDALGHATHYEYDPDGELVSVTDPTGATMRYAYDRRGNLIEAADALGLVVRFEYDSRGLIERMHFANGGVAHIRRDAHGNRSEVIEPDGTTKRIEYDYLGRPVRFLDARGNETRYTYDRRGHLAALRQPHGGVLRMAYDAEGRLCRTTNPDGRVAEYVWAGVGVVIEIRESGGCIVRARYDREGQLVRVINEKGEEHLYERSAAGLVVGERTFDGRRLRYENDLAGNLIEIDNALGEKIELKYDAVGQLIEKAYADGAVIQYEYDPLGHIERATSPDAIYTCAYDARGRRVKETFEIGGRSFSIESAYDEMNVRTSRRTSLGHTEQITRDIRGRPIEVLLDDRDALQSLWDPGGLEVARKLPGGAVIQSAFDPMQQLTRRSVVAGAVKSPAGAPPGAPRLTVDRGYRHNFDGEVLEEYDHVFGRVRYELDPIGQLTARIPQQGLPEMFTYDEAQNVQESAPGSSKRSYESGGRCVLAKGVSYVYDGESRMIEKHVPRAGGGRDTWRYEWSARGMLSKVERPDGVVIEFGYDAFDRRMFKRMRKSDARAGDVMTFFVWDRTLPLHEIRERASSSGDPIVEERTYLFSDETAEPIGHRDVLLETGTRTSGSWVFYVTNQVDAPEHLVAGDGTVLGSVSVSAFGEATWTESSRQTTSLRFRGQYADDETGLYYNFTRYYDPFLCTYISADPTNIEQDIRLFAYAGNRPRTFTDPYGLADPLTTTVTMTDGSKVKGHSKGHHTKNKTTGKFEGGGGTLPVKKKKGDPNFPDLPGKNTGPNECGECEALNKIFDGLDPDNPDHHEEIKRRAKEIDKITPKRQRDGKVLPACAYCSQRLAKLSDVSGVNLIDKLAKPSPPKKNKFTNIRDKKAKAKLTKDTQGKFPYSFKRNPDGTTQITRPDGTVVQFDE